MSVDRASAEVWAGWFRALGDASRVLILNRLAVARRPMTVGEIVDAVDVGQSTVSHHLKLLADTGFVLVADELHRKVNDVNDPVEASLGQKIHGTRIAYRSFVAHLRAEGVRALENAIGKRSR
jgi:DNA-binding transcriptional ArsR family regulator